MLRKSKQFLIILLTIIISLSSILTVYADGNVSGDNSGGGTSSMNTSTNYKAWSNNHQGYRFYMINDNLERVSAIYDFCFTIPTSINNRLHTTRFDSSTSPDEWYTYSISDLANITESNVSEIPKPVVNGQGQGQQFRAWFLRNIPFQNIGGTPIISSGSSGSSGSTREPVGGSTSGSATGQYEQFITLGERVSNLEGQYDKLGDDERTNLRTYIGNATVFFKAAYKQISELQPSLSTSEKEFFALGFVYKQLSTYNLSTNMKNYLISYVYRNRTVYIGSITASVNNIDLLNTNIPLAGEDETTSVDGCPALLLLQDRNNLIRVSGYENAFIAMAEANYMLCVEPITWIYVPSGSSYPSAGNKTYGSYWDICNQWVSRAGVQNGGFYRSYMSVLGNNCLTVNSEVQTESGKVLHAADLRTRNVLESLNDMMNSGLSLHIYSSDTLLGGDLPVEQIDLAGDWTLTESEISKPVTTASRTSLVPMSYMLHTLENCNTSHLVCQHNCGGTCARRSCSRDHEHSSSCRSRYCGHSHGGSCYKYCDSYSLEDRALTFTLRNEKENDYPLLLHALSGTKNNEVQGNRTTTKDETLSPSGFTYDFVVYRGNDKLNYAKYKNNINNLGFLPVDSKTNVTRKTEDYIEHLQISLVDNSADLETSAKGNLHSSLFIDNAESETSINYDGTVVINVYSGKTRLPNLDINENTLMRLTNIRDDSTAGRQIDSKAELRFNPYIRMTYAGLDNIKHDAYVIGEYQRIIYPNDYAEIQWTYEPENMTVRSSMWALDKMYTDGNDDLDWTSPNKVLKGGATYNLVTKKKVVGLNTYQVILGNSSRTISEITGEFNLSESEAISEHEAFVEKALDRFDKTEVIQYVSKNVNDETAWENGIPVYKGADLRELNNGGSTASTEAKYYLETDVNNHENVSRNDLDVKELGTTKKYYRFYSDTSGNIFMVEGNSVTEVEAGTGSQILNKTQSVDSLSGMAQFLNNRTLVITKLLDALERNTGNDTTASWAPDGKWYNEAYNGVIIIVQRTGVELEFRLTNERMCVLDPKLVPYIESKLSQVKSENRVAHMSQYCTNLSSGEPISLFKGQGVYMYRANELFNSNKFYIPCMTVQN